MPQESPLWRYEDVAVQALLKETDYDFLDFDARVAVAVVGVMLMLQQAPPAEAWAATHDLLLPVKGPRALAGLGAATITRLALNSLDGEVSATGYGVLKLDDVVSQELARTSRRLKNLTHTRAEAFAKTYETLRYDHYPEAVRMILATAITRLALNRRASEETED